MRHLSAEEQALWRKVVLSVRPLEGRCAPEQPPAPIALEPVELTTEGWAVRDAGALASAPTRARAQPGTTLDGSWDRRLSRGLVQPDMVVDLHGHSLATAYDLLDRKLDQAVAAQVRVMLLITGKPPAGDRRPVLRGAIRAAVGDWLTTSRHAGAIAAVRNAHPRHGGNGALYLIFRRTR